MACKISSSVQLHSTNLNSNKVSLSLKNIGSRMSRGYSLKFGSKTYSERQRKKRILEGKMRNITCLVLKQFSLAMMINIKGEVSQNWDGELLDGHPYTNCFCAKL